jgi:hypothetical protein
MVAYLFVYFTGDSIEGEKLRFAVSDGNNALQWRDLNDARPILESTMGTRGLRDPFILRSAEGDRFFLLATDLSVGRTGWGHATDDGSQYLEIWESTDLVHWGEQRHLKVNTPMAGMTWAPEASYDPSIQAYIVYWTSTLFRDAAHKQGDGHGPQILMSTTRDFRHFTTPQPWFQGRRPALSGEGQGHDRHHHSERRQGLLSLHQGERAIGLPLRRHHGTKVPLAAGQHGVGCLDGGRSLYRPQGGHAGGRGAKRLCRQSRRCQRLPLFPVGR